MRSGDQFALEISGNDAGINIGHHPQTVVVYDIRSRDRLFQRRIHLRRTPETRRRKAMAGVGKTFERHSRRRRSQRMQFQIDAASPEIGAHVFYIICRTAGFRADKGNDLNDFHDFALKLTVPIIVYATAAAVVPRH